MAIPIEAMVAPKLPAAPAAAPPAADPRLGRADSSSAISGILSLIVSNNDFGILSTLSCTACI